MTVTKAVQRLSRVLFLEEELRRKELLTAQSELVRLEEALKLCGQEERNGRSWMAVGLQSGDLADRLAGIEEIKRSRRGAVAMRPLIDQSTLRVEECRAAFLDKRVERKQAKTLVEVAETREAIEVNRKSQQSLDDWYLTKQPSALSKPKEERS